jgi:HK97 family phage prohead protease
MPIPKPNYNESDKDFLDRCMVDPTMVEEYDDKQRYAVCESQLQENKNTMEKNINERHIKKIVEDENSITIVYAKTEDFEGIEIDKEDEIVEEEVVDEVVEENDHIPGHTDEEEIVEEIDEEEEEEIEEDPALEYANRSTNKVDVWDEKHTQEKRFFEVETRIDKKEGKDVVVGHAAVFNSLSEDLGGFREKIMPGAFDDVLSNDVRAYFNHDPNFLLGRVSAGTLRLGVDEKGLRYELDIPNTTAGRDLKENMRLGNITQSSFAFTLGKGGDSWERNEDGMDIRIIHKVDRLYDVSPVSLSAYPSADNLALAVRSNFIDKEKTRKKQEEEFEKNTLLNLKINLLKRKK